MSHPTSLTRLSIAAAVANGKKIVERIIRSKGEERLRLWHLIQKLIWALRLWNLPDCIDSYFVNTGTLSVYIYIYIYIYIYMMYEYHVVLFKRYLLT